MRDPTIDISITTPKAYNLILAFLMPEGGRPQGNSRPHALPPARRSGTPASSGNGIQVQQRKSRKPEKQS
jgi:hypothetical protein